MKKTEKVFQSEELAKNWESVGAYRPWWFDTSTKYAKIYTFDGKGIPIVWDDEETEFTVEETRECTGDDTCALVLSNKKKRVLGPGAPGSAACDDPRQHRKEDRMAGVHQRGIVGRKEALPRLQA